MNTSMHLQNLPAQFAAIVESSNDAIIGKSMARVITTWNPAAQRIFGYTAAEAIGQPMSMLIPSERSEEEDDIFRRVSAGKIVDSFETVRVRKDGSRVEISTNVSPVKDDDGKIVGVSQIARDITRQRQAQAALRESEERFGTVIENMSEGLVVAALSGQILHVNRAALEMLGFSQEDDWIKRKPDFSRIFQVLDLDGILLPADRWPLARVAQGEAVHGLEILLRRTESDWQRAFSYNGALVHQPDGTDIAFLTITDVTERKLAETALRLSEERFRTTLENLMEGCQIIDRNWRYLYVNEVAARHGEKPALELTGRTMMQVYPGIEQTSLFSTLRTAMEGRQAIQIENNFVYPGGRSAWFELFIQPVPEGLFILSLDITARKSAENAVHLSEERFQLVARATNDMLWDWNLDTDQQWWNEAYFNFLGLPPAELAPPLVTWQQFVHPDDLPALIGGFDASVASGGSSRTTEFRLRSANGQYAHVLDRAYILRDANGRAYRVIGSVLDITERKRSEEEIRQLNAGLEERVALRTAELLAANQELEAFSYSVSHDLRAPLRGIDGFSQILQEDYAPKLDAEGVRLLGIISHEAQRMGRLIDDLLKFSRLSRQPLEASAVNMTELAGSVFDEMTEARGQTALKFHLDDLPHASGDQAMLRQVFVNLIGNALKFSSKRSQPSIQVTGSAEHGSVTYCVKDNGAGFDAKFRDRLFGVFQRLHGEHEFPGTGVGLALVQRIVHRHGGKVWATGQVDHGAAFYFRLSAPAPVAQSVLCP